MAASGGESPPADPIVVLLADLPGLFTEVLTAMIQGRGDLRLAGVFDHDPAALAMAAPSAQVLVVGGPPGRVDYGPAASYAPLLRVAPGLRIIVLATGDDVADLYWLGLCHWRQPVASTEQLADIVLGAVAIDAYKLP